MKRISSHRFRRTTLLLVCFLGILVGIGIAHRGMSLGPAWFLLLALPLAVSMHKKDSWGLLIIVLFALCLGWWRGSVYMYKLDDWQRLYGHKVTITAIAMNDGVYAKNAQITFDANHVQVDGSSLTGRLSLSGFGTNAVFQGDTVQATGKLYVTLGAAQARMSFAQLQVTGHHSTLVPELRRKFAAGMQNALPEPLASFAMGLLVGQRATLPADVKQELLMVGLTHIIAVSGYNLTIMLRASKGIFGKKSKRISTFLSLALIGIFLLFAGSSASIVRAAIVSVLSIWAGYYGRQVKPLLLITFAAAITAFANPFYVWSDAGWYLSFLAFYGVMVLAPMLEVRLRARWQKSLVMMVALESLCAEVMTLPFVLHTFGQMSFIGLVGNVMVVALVPLAMLLSLIAGLAGMLMAPIAGWFAWPARLLLTYMLDAASMLSRIPHIFVENMSLPTLQMLLLYILTAAMTMLLWQKTKDLNSGTITDKN